MNPVSVSGVIRVSFDIEQISSYAMWGVSQTDNPHNPYSSLGLHAGAIRFRKAVDEVQRFIAPIGRQVDQSSG